MIEEVKQLLTLIQNVPDMVLHVLAGFAVYKIVIFLGTSVGVYSTIRFAISKFCEMRTKAIEFEKYKLDNPPKTVFEINGRTIGKGTEEDLRSFLATFSGTGTSYIHASDVTELRRVWEEHKKKKSVL